MSVSELRTRGAARRAWLKVAPAQFAMAWGGNHFTPLLHMYEQRAHYSETATNLLLGTYVFGLVPGLLCAAALSDRHGRRRVMLAGVAASLAGSAVLAAGFPLFSMLLLGRILAGAGVGVAMSVGTSWIKELSTAPHDRTAGRAAQARRPALTLTLGFGLGAGVSGTLAQWAPIPTVLPYLVHIALGLATAIPLFTAPETVTPHTEGHWWQDLRVPSIAHRRFVRVVVPSAPWVFATAGIAYALLPEIVQSRLGGDVLIYATGLCVLTLSAGALIQPQVPRINRFTHGHALSVGLSLITLGVVVAAVSAALRSPVVAVLAAPLLGCGYGIGMVCGLQEIQRIATPDDLAGMTGLFYSLTYVGFLLPTLISALAGSLSYAALLAIVAAAAALCVGAVSRANIQVGEQAQHAQDVHAQDAAAGGGDGPLYAQGEAA